MNLSRESPPLKVESVSGLGLWAPITERGTIVVNDIVASSYASIENHTVSLYPHKSLSI